MTTTIAPPRSGSRSQSGRGLRRALKAAGIVVAVVWIVASLLGGNPHDRRPRAPTTAEAAHVVRIQAKWRPSDTSATIVVTLDGDRFYPITQGGGEYDFTYPPFDHRPTVALQVTGRLGPHNTPGTLWVAAQISIDDQVVAPFDLNTSSLGYPPSVTATSR